MFRVLIGVAFAGAVASGAAQAATLIRFGTIAAGQQTVNLNWGYNPPKDDIYITFRNAEVVQLRYHRDNAVYDEEGSDYTIGVFRCSFNGLKSSCSDGIRFDHDPLGTLHVSAGRVLQTFNGWPGLPDGYRTSDGALIVSDVEEYDSSFDIRVQASQHASYQVYSVKRGDPFAVVPEPATWGLMIMGFGAAGALLRRRATVPA